MACPLIADGGRVQKKKKKDISYIGSIEMVSGLSHPITEQRSLYFLEAI